MPESSPTHSNMNGMQGMGLGPLITSGSATSGLGGEKNEVNNYREEEREIRCGGKYGNGVKEFLGCASTQCDSGRAQIGGKQRNSKRGRSGGSRRSQ